MLCADIMRQAGDISDAEWNFFLRGSAGVDKVQTILFSSLWCHTVKPTMLVAITGAS